MTSELEEQATERRLHPAGVAILAIRGAGSAWFVAVAIVASAGPRVGLPIVLALAAVVAAFAYVEWRTTRYAVVDGGLRYRSGVLSRKELDVPASRISALDSTRGVLQRIFGVVALQVQTAGGGGKAEVVLHAVSPAEAERLRRALGHRGADRAAEPAAGTQDGAVGDAGAGPRFVATDALPQEEAETVLRMSTRDLLLAGVTSPSGALIGAIFALFYGPLNDVAGDSTKQSLESSAERAITSAPLVVLGLVVAGVVAFSVLGTVFAYAGFEVTRDERRLRVRRGLLTERTGTVQLDRIHALRIVETPIRQALGYVSIEAEVAGWALQDQSVKTIAPFVRRAALPEFLPRLVPGYRWTGTALQQPPPRATRRYVVRSCWLPGAVAVGLIAAPFGWWGVAGAVVVLVAGAALGMWQARTAGWLLDQHLLVMRTRRFARFTVIAPVDRLQQRAATVTPFQRRAKLATLQVRLSSQRQVEVAFLDAHTVASLLARLRPRVAAVRGARPAGAG